MPQCVSIAESHWLGMHACGIWDGQDGSTKQHRAMKVANNLVNNR